VSGAISRNIGAAQIDLADITAAHSRAPTFGLRLTHTAGAR
jgi:hypothetical protein